MRVGMMLRVGVRVMARVRLALSKVKGEVNEAEDLKGQVSG